MSAHEPLSGDHAGAGRAQGRAMSATTQPPKAVKATIDPNPLSCELVQTFGLVVRRLRESRSWSQEQLAAVSDLNRSYVGEVERGRVTASIVTAQKLARAFEVDVASLLGRCEQMERERAERLRALVAIAG